MVRSKSTKQPMNGMYMTQLASLMNNAAAPIPVPKISMNLNENLPTHIEVTRVFCFVLRRCASPVATCLQIRETEMVSGAPRACGAKRMSKSDCSTLGIDFLVI